MSKTKQFLEMLAATAGCSSVAQYLQLLEKQEQMDRDWEEYNYWKDVDSGDYFKDAEDDPAQEVG